MCGEQERRKDWFKWGKNYYKDSVFLHSHSIILTPSETNIWPESAKVHVLCIWWRAIYTSDRTLTLCKKSAYVTAVNTENVLMHQWRWIIVNSSGALALVSTCCCLWLAAAHQLPRVLWPGWVSRTPRCPHSALRQRSQPQLPSHTSLPSWPWAVEKHRHQPCLPSSH